MVVTFVLGFALGFALRVMMQLNVATWKRILLHLHGIDICTGLMFALSHAFT